MKKSIFISGIFLALTVTGCNSEQVEVIESAEPPPPRNITFRGEPSPLFVGTWKQERAEIRYTFKSDATYKYGGTINTPGGSRKISNEGTWGVADQKLYLKSSQGEVSELAATVSGNQATFTTTGQMKIVSKFLKE